MDLRTVPPGDAAEQIALHGCAVVPGVLSPAEVRSATAALDQVFAAEADVAEDRGWRTDARLVAYALPAKHDVFLQLCTHPGLLALADEVLGPDCVVAGFNGLTMVAGGRGQDIHADHPVPTPGTTLFLHLVCALDPFTEANGATRVVPGSHLEGPPPAGIDLERRAVPAEVGAGGVVAFDAALQHAGSANRSSGPRRALHVFFARPWVQPHWDLPATLSAETAGRLDEEQRRRLGYDRRRPAVFDLDARRVVRDG